MQRTPAIRINPTAKGVHQIIRDAARKGFSVRYHPDRDGYVFRHALGKFRFFTPELHYVTEQDIEVWQ